MGNVRKNNSVDCYVGSRLRMLRKSSRMSQAKLANMMNLSHQQIQQYELGLSRISAGTLYEITTLLDVPVEYFFEGVQTICPAGGAEKEFSFERETPLDILLVESAAVDEARFRDALSECDHETNIHVERSGIDALDFLRGKRTSAKFVAPELIVLDLNVDSKDGFDVLKEVKYDRNLVSIPIVVIAAGADYEEISKAYSRHASGFIRKSVDEKKFSKNLALMVDYWSTTILPSMRCS